MKTLSLLPNVSHDHPQADWFIGPCGHHRDSELIAESNWDVMLASFSEADPERADHEVHRFGHWAVGWVEEVTYRPGSKVAEVADKLRDSLDDYPILSESHHSALETAAEDENMPQIMGDLRRSLAKYCRDNWIGWDEDVHGDALQDLDDDKLQEAARGYGEHDAGWIRYSASDVIVIADRLAPLLGYE